MNYVMFAGLGNISSLWERKRWTNVNFLREIQNLEKDHNIVDNLDKCQFLDINLMIYGS